MPNFAEQAVLRNSGGVGLAARGIQDRNALMARRMAEAGVAPPQQNNAQAMLAQQQQLEQRRKNQLVMDFLRQNNGRMLTR